MNKDLEMVKKVAKRVKTAGGEMYFVGGYVRDLYLGRESKDIDVEVHGLEESTFVKLLSELGQVDKVGASFGVYLLKGLDVDFALPRKEQQTGLLHTDFDVKVDPFIGTYEASRRRDFTMNAVMKDVLTGEIIDFFGGREDMDNKLIKMVDRETFKEDALRLFRAIQFSARFDFEIDKETREVAEKMELSHLAKERIYDEIRKGMTKGKSDIFVNVLKSYHNVAEVMPSLQFLPNFNDTELTNGRNLALNIGFMGTKVEEKAFLTLIEDFLQLKQERKRAFACRNFLLDVKNIEKNNLKQMFRVIAKHKSFIESESQALNGLVSVQMNLDTNLYHKALVEKESCLLLVDGDWLIKRGLMPSQSFAKQMQEAQVLAWSGSTEEMIINEVIMGETPHLVEN